MIATGTRIGLALAAILLLAACGDEQNLTPAKGASLPPKALTAATQPTADQLLAPGAQARPGRRDDHFDLPPQ